MKRTWMTTLAGLGLATLLTGCGSDSAAKISSCIEAGAKQLRSSAQRELTIACPAEKRLPYLVIAYPDVRSETDTKILRQYVEKAAALSPGGAGLSPTLEGLSGTLVVWQQGTLVKFSKAFRSSAQARQVFVAEKPDGAATTVTLKKEGLDVYITGLY
ncbi:MAG TPA: hypothetical protein P5234_14995 [Thermoanaerobaculaceae bacterium]|nr:hypothetical protein [Thermoanaerobaculaceae bacterium]HRS17540.1 hypothetical protein [Thermoanaerobaculaceae bacterium]